MINVTNDIVAVAGDASSLPINIYAIFAILATILCSVLAVIVYLTNRRGAINRTFIFAITLGAYTAFTTFMMIQAESVQTAFFWNKAAFLWPFFSVALLDFVIVFTQNRLSTDRRRYLFLYLPAVLFSFLDLTTDLISGVPVKTVFGYEFITSDSFVATIDNIWLAAVAITSVTLCLWYYYKSVDENKKQQAKIVGIALAYPLIISLSSIAAFLLIGWHIPYYGVGANAIMCAFIVYAIWKYNLFNLNPATAAENIISSMPDAFILCDSIGRIIRVNTALTDLVGYRENELIGQKVNKLFDPKQDTLLEDLFHKQELRGEETEFTTRSGAKRSVAISSSLIKAKNGGNIGVTIIVHDLTRRKQDEARIVKSEHFAAIGQLAGMVGHDLRNPLSSLQAATYYIRKKNFDQLDSTSQEMLDVMQTSIECSNKIINDLLDYSREVTLEIEESSATRLTQNALLMLDVPAGIHVVNLTEDSPTVYVDNVKIGRVIVNIMKNGFEAMPNGGKFTIRSGKVGTNLELSFEDTGTGMSEEIMEKLWKPLFTTKAKGMGFGLPICKRIVEAHGGKIQVKSKVGEGTTFTVSVPLTANNKNRSTSMT